jgi:hypothetical protein
MTWHLFKNYMALLTFESIFIMVFVNKLTFKKCLLLIRKLINFYFKTLGYLGILLKDLKDNAWSFWWALKLFVMLTNGLIFKKKWNVCK